MGGSTEVFTADLSETDGDGYVPADAVTAAIISGVNIHRDDGNDVLTITIHIDGL